MKNNSKYTSLRLSEILYRKGFIFDYDFIWKRGELVPTGNQHPPFTSYQWNLIEDDGSVGYKEQAFPAYDILNDLCVKYPKKLFGEILLKKEEYPIFSQEDVAWSFFHHPEMVLSYLQQNQKEEAEKYIIENLVN